MPYAEGEVDLRRTENPTAVPNATGKRIAAAGLEKTAAGSVIEGMKVVMLTVLENLC